MYKATLHALTINKDKQYKAHFAVDYDGVEEENCMEFKSILEVPRFLFTLRDGKIVYFRGKVVYFSEVFTDANGTRFWGIRETHAF